MTNFKIYAEKELAAVTHYLKQNNIAFTGIRKWCMEEDEKSLCKKWADDLGVDWEFNADDLLSERCDKKECFSDGDVVVKLKNGETILFEVQEDRRYKPSRNRKINLDAMSVFYFRDDKYKRGDHVKPSDWADFLEHIRIKKLGKIDYCKSDVLLFWHHDEKGKIDFVEGYDFQLLKKCFIKEFCLKYVEFNINLKKDTASEDTYESGLYKVNAYYFRKFKVGSEADILKYRKRDLKMIDKLRVVKGYVNIDDHKASEEEQKQKIFNALLGIYY